MTTHQADPNIITLDDLSITTTQQVSTSASPESQNPVSAPDWLSSFKGCAHYSSTEAQEVLESLNSLAKILLEFCYWIAYINDNQQKEYA